MKNGIIIFLAGIIIIIIGVQFFGEGKDMVTTDDGEISKEELEEISVGNSEAAEDTSKVTTPVPTQQTPVPTPTPAPTQTRSSSGEGAIIVTYTDDGFIPSVVEVEAGKVVRFVNASSKPMWVTSFDHPTATEQYYREFDQGKSAVPGETYTFLFTKVGVWGYKNFNFEKHLGAVSVLEQD